MLSLIIFGPNKLPDIAKSMGKGIYEFRKITSKVSDSIKEESDNIKKEASLKEQEPKNTNNDTENKDANNNAINLNK
jgi:sec-independent protein translocase protein TatA